MSDNFEKLVILQERLDGQILWLKEHCPEVFEQQKHTEEGSEQRNYWHYGYSVALRDVIALFLRSTGEETTGER